jgi:hypothetical protein
MKRLSLISRTLGRVPSVLYGVVYLALIPAFASMYQLMPGAFYHSTVHLEPTFRAEQQAISAELEKSIIDSLAYLRKKAEDPRAIWRLEDEELTVHDLTATPDGMVRFSLSGTLYGPRNSVMVRGLSIELSPWQKEPYTSRNASFAMLPACYADYKDNAYDPDVGDLLPYRRDLSDDGARAFIITTPGCGGLLTVSRTLLRRLQGYSLASRGLAGYSPRSFGRMLYLSAVTLTTTGFGDIVPLTEKARTLVTSEAILGVILVGLFLNALAHEIVARGEGRF